MDNRQRTATAALCLIMMLVSIQVMAESKAVRLDYNLTQYRDEADLKRDTAALRLQYFPLPFEHMGPVNEQAFLNRSPELLLRIFRGEGVARDYTERYLGQKFKLLWVQQSGLPWLFWLESTEIRLRRHGGLTMDDNFSETLLAAGRYWGNSRVLFKVLQSDRDINSEVYGDLAVSVRKWGLEIKRVLALRGVTALVFEGAASKARYEYASTLSSSLGDDNTSQRVYLQTTVYPTRHTGIGLGFETLSFDDADAQEGGYPRFSLVHFVNENAGVHFLYEQFSAKNSSTVGNREHFSLGLEWRF